MTSSLAIPPERVERRILLIRTQNVMLDADLADLCAVSGKRRNELVRRDINRFSADFMFELAPGGI